MWAAPAISPQGDIGQLISSRSSPQLAKAPGFGQTMGQAGGDAPAFNFNQGVAVRVPASHFYGTIRAFAVVR